MEAFFAVVMEVAVILILILVGYITVKRGMFTKESLSSITSFLLYIVTPCLIVSSFLSAESGRLDGWTLLLAAALPAASIVISIAASYLFFRRETADRRRVLRFSMIFCNVGFMGIPLVEGIVGSEGVLYGSFFIAVFNIFCWTYGYVMMGGGKVKLRALVLNPGVIGIAVGLPLYLLDVPLPQLVVEPVELISALNTPLAMIVVGGYIAQVKLRAFVSDFAVYRMAALRLVVLPLLYLAVVWLARPSDTLLMSTAIQGATPVAANCVLFAVQYGSDAELASKSVAVTTALSVITIPLIAVLVQVLL